MTGRFVAAAAIGLITAAASPCVAGAAGSKDRVNGGGELRTAPPGSSNPPNHFSINAQSNPDGTDAFGILHFTSAQQGLRFDADILCLRVVGNRASILARFRHTKNEPPRLDGGGIVVFVEDNGNPQPGGQSSDRHQNTRLSAPRFDLMVQMGCPDPTLASLVQQLRGNIHVTDALTRAPAAMSLPFLR
jgi:hypothetical protein